LEEKSEYSLFTFYLCYTPVPAEYLTEIQIDAENTFIIDQLMSYLMAFSFPYKVSDSTNITEINITTGMNSVLWLVLYTSYILLKLMIDLWILLFSVFIEPNSVSV